MAVAENLSPVIRKQVLGYRQEVRRQLFER